MDNKGTNCYSYFAICSNGVLDYYNGFIAAENSDFGPDSITEALGIIPFDTAKKGTPRKSGRGLYPFSRWCGCKQTEPKIDVYEQCLKIVRELKPLIPVLSELKKKYNIQYTIQSVPSIYNDSTPIVCFDSEIIEFCYLTGTEIGVDMYCMY